MSTPPQQPDLGFLRRRSRGSTHATPPPGAGVDLELGPALASRQPTSTPTVDLSLQTVPATASTAAAAPGVPALGWIRRRPPQRSAPDLRRTGNEAVDFSNLPVVGGASSRVREQTPLPLRGRIPLSAERPKVLIGGEQAATGSLQFTLTWSTQPPNPRAAAAGMRRSTDVHLGCLWEMNDRSSGLIQLLGGGSDSARCDGNTVLRLGGRSETDGQTLVASLRQMPLLNRMVLFVYANNGVPEWGPLNVHLSATLKGGVAVELTPSPGPTWATVLAIASVHRVGGTLVVRREDQYLSGQQSSVGWAYGFDSLSWSDERTIVQPRLR